MTGQDSDYLFEFRRVGAFLKATVIDPATGTEVSVVGPATGSRELLARTAVSKLKYVMQRDAAKSKK